MVKRLLMFVLLMVSFHFVFADDEPGRLNIKNVDVGQARLCVFRPYGLIALSKGQLVSIDVKEELPRLSQAVEADDIYQLEQDVIFKCGEALLDANLDTLANFDTSEYRLFPVQNDDIFFLVMSTDSVSCIFTFNVLGQETELLLKTQEPVVYVCGISSDFYLVTETHIYRYSDKGGLCMMTYFEPIRSAALTSMGLFFATDHNLLLLCGINEVNVILKESVSRLYANGDVLYVHFSDNTIGKYELP